MAYTLLLSTGLVARGWKVKIRDRERCETPHATIRRKLETWRMSLRNEQFLDRAPPPRDVPEAVMEAVMEAIAAGLLALIQAWNQMYPESPV